MKLLIVALLVTLVIALIALFSHAHNDPYTIMFEKANGQVILLKGYESESGGECNTGIFFHQGFICWLDERLIY